MTIASRPIAVGWTSGGCGRTDSARREQQELFQYALARQRRSAQIPAEMTMLRARAVQRLPTSNATRARRP